jgi:hypothetical protein
MKMHLCACAKLSFRPLGKIGAEIAVLSWNKFYCHGTTALFHNQETEPLRMLQTELSLSWQDSFRNRSAFVEPFLLPGDQISVP